MSEANYKLIRDIPRITHINLHNEYLKRKVVFINLYKYNSSRKNYCFMS